VKAAICILFSLVTLQCPAQGIRMAEAAGRVVEMTLVKAVDLSSVAWPEGTTDLTQVSTIAKGDTNVYMLLQANGIAPDSEAFALVYDLNPALKDANNIAAGTSVELPSVSGNSSLLKLLESGNLVELTLDPAIHAELNQRIDGLQAVLPSISQLTLDPEAQTQIKGLIGWYQQIEKRSKRRTAPPLRRASLIQLRDEAGLLSSILLDALQRHRQLSSTEQRQIGGIYEDIKLEMTQFGEVLASVAPAAQSFFAVTVNIKGAEPAHLDGLRVYYTYNGLYRALPANPPIVSYGFKQLGSGRPENLLMKNYQIWAAKDGDSNHPVTLPYLLRIESTTPSSVSVDLSLSGGPRP
jgi:hypothetical protein